MFCFSSFLQSSLSAAKAAQDLNGLKQKIDNEAPLYSLSMDKVMDATTQMIFTFEFSKCFQFFDLNTTRPKNTVLNDM